jgi:transposase
VLFTASGRQDKEIAARMAITPKKVSRWRKRFLALGMAGLEKDAPRPGRKRKIGARLTKRVVTLTTRQQPANATHWSTRTMAAAAGISEASVRRIWRAHGLKPHRVETFKIRQRSGVRGEAGRHRRPVPQSAGARAGAVRRREEPDSSSGPYSAWLALEARTRRHHDARLQTQRYGHTVCRAECGQRRGLWPVPERHRHQEWLTFLHLIDQTIPADRQLHLICDNYATHKHPKVQRWLARHPRFHLHFTPTSASWLNMVERFFRDLTHNRLRRGVFRDLEELIMAIGTYIDRHNESPKPFIWTARAADILEKVKRARRTLNKRQSA